MPQCVTRTYRGLCLDIAAVEGSRICYILLPEGLKDDGRSWIGESSARFGVTIVVISGMDWNDTMTPWSAEGVFRKEKPFGGHAERFLKELREDYLPSIESSLGMKHPERFLAGVSLSGLFALWSVLRCDLFKAVASVSGSLWFDGFTQWAEEQELSLTAVKIFISLGDREKKSRDRRMATVETETLKTVDILRAKGASVEFLLEEGTTHFSPVVPRLEKAFETLFR